MPRHSPLRCKLGKQGYYTGVQARWGLEVRPRRRQTLDQEQAAVSQYKRGKVWWVRFQADGEEVRRSARTTSRAVARDYERQLREEFGRVKRGGRPRISYRQAMERFVLEHLPTLKPETARRYRTSAKALHEHFEALDLDDIRQKTLSDYVIKRKRHGVSRDGIRNDLACLSSMFSCCISWEWAEENPVQAFRKRSLGAPVSRTRYLSHDEEKALVEAAGKYLRPMILFAIDTGLRLEEQLSLTWDQVNLKRSEIFIPKTKTDNPRTVPLLERSAHILAQQPHHIASPYVFTKKDGSRYGKLTRGLAGAAGRAKVENLRWHDLRRTCGCRLLQDYGMDIHKVSKWLGHRSVTVTERAYAFLRAEDLHRAVRTKVGTEHGD